MARPNRASSNIHEIFSDVAFLMLATFVFLLVIVLISARFTEQKEMPKLRAQISSLQNQLEQAKASEQRANEKYEEKMQYSIEDQVDAILESAHIGKKDFNLYVQGLKDLPGKDIHLIVDATGSMHGVAGFLAPVLRLIVYRANKELSAMTWYANGNAKTYQGSMGDMFDFLMSEAPFSGHMETIGHAFQHAAIEAPAPGAYILIGDEPSDDKIRYHEIPSPVFTLALGRSHHLTLSEYRDLAEKTHGKMLHMDFQ